MMDLLHMRTFLAIYRTGSIGKAATQLRMSQPAVSNHLKALEAQVGRALFERHARGVAPTPAAEELVARVGPPLDALEAIGEHVRAGARGASGTVHLGGPIDLLSSKIVPALAALQADRDGPRFLVRPGLAPELLDLLAKGELDLVVTADASSGRFEYDALAVETLVLVVGPRRWKKITSLRGADARVRVLAEGPFVSFASDMPVVREFFQTVLGPGFTASPTLVIPDLRAVATAVSAGIGTSVLPKHVVDPLLQAGTLFAVATDAPGRRRQLSIATRPGTRATPRIAVVRERLLLAAKTW